MQESRGYKALNSTRTDFKNRSGFAAALCVVAILSVLAAAVCLQVTVPGSAFWSKWIGDSLQKDGSAMLAFCEQLQCEAKQLCLKYGHATADGKWDAAVHWRQKSPTTYACAGVDAECLHQDMFSDAPGSTCRPLQSGANCKLGPSCSTGALAAEERLDSSSQPSDSAVAHSSEADQQQQHDENGQLHRILAQTNVQMKENSMAKMGQLVKPVAVWPTATTSVLTSKPGRRVQDTFLATSHEYTRIADYGDERTVQAWAEVFNMLSPSPVIRVGGASQDKMKQVPGEATWKALKRLRDRTNARFILGLPLWPKNSVNMCKQLMAASQKYLNGSIIGYELGNEPEFWPTGLGGWNATTGKWVDGIDAYFDWFDKVARAVNPCNSKKKLLSGPGWGNVNTQPHEWLAQVMYAGKNCYLWETSVHYYPYINNETVTAKQLLSQPLQNFGLEKYNEYQRIVDKEKMGLRISETNSLYGGGRAGMSDTLVGGLWVGDALFAFADAGARALHLHWGIGGHPTGELGQPNTGVQTNFYYKYKGQTYEYKQLAALRIDVSKLEQPVPWPSVHAPFYGYLFWIIAAAGNYGSRVDTTFVKTRLEDKGKCGANMKVWALKADNGDLRIALINKDETSHCNMKIWIDDPKYCKAAATISRLLPGVEGINSRGGISWQGQTYDNAGYTGKIQGDKVLQQLLPQQYPKAKTCGFEVPVPAASAALVIAKKK